MNSIHESDARFPRLEIDLQKLSANLAVIGGSTHGAGCSLMVVTKSFCADSRITGLLLESEWVDYIADSRVQNLAHYAGKGKETVLLRLPQMCEIADVVRFADISFNSELETIRLLDAEAAVQNRIHKIILMIDLGDLREGFYYKDERLIFETIEQIQKLRHITLCGIAVNLTCYGGVIPKYENLSRLSSLAGRIEALFHITLPIISGGNSSSYYLIEKGELPSGITNLRLGESFILGNDTAYLSRIEGTYNDAVLFTAQIIELKTKPSMPEGEIGVDAFGNKPEFEDRGPVLRAIAAAGRQDIDPAGLTPTDPKVRILGASSDHLLLEIGGGDYSVGGAVSFALNYSAFLRAFTSPYVGRQYF
ncbi:MAG: alanine/ornithine racemase family PLP-dependent enzyme [Spirochaetaceae bacterium]|nr:alanine/ornithine racemase family PLP-dependent enzyme [Spirochaetaceae bacterium]